MASLPISQSRRACACLGTVLLCLACAGPGLRPRQSLDSALRPYGLEAKGTPEMQDISSGAFNGNDNGYLGGWVSTKPDRLKLSQFYWMG